MSPTETLAGRVEALCGDLSRIRAPRGTELNARSWSTEAPLRMLLNNLDAEVAERPEELVVYGGTGKAARNPEALRVLDNAERTLAIELLAGAQAIEFLAPLRPGEGVSAVHDAVRALSPRLSEDRSLSADIEAVADAIRSGTVVAAAESEIGALA